MQMKENEVVAEALAMRRITAQAEARGSQRRRPRPATKRRLFYGGHEIDADREVLKEWASTPYSHVTIWIERNGQIDGGDGFGVCVTKDLFKVRVVHPHFRNGEAVAIGTVLEFDAISYERIAQANIDKDQPLFEPVPAKTPLRGAYFAGMPSDAAKAFRIAARGLSKQEGTLSLSDVVAYFGKVKTAPVWKP
jgi:hypothetical protein